MNENSYVCVIPRNLNKSDLIINTPIKLDWKQFGYLIGGTLLGSFVYSFDVDFLLKVPLISLIGLVSVFGAFYKYEGQTMDDMLLNSFSYISNKKMYEKNKKGDCVVKINSRKNEEQTLFSSKQLITLQNT